MNLKVIFLSWFLILFSCINCTIILTPPTKSGAIFNASLIFLQGASIPASNYKQYAQQLQQKFRYGSNPANLWVALTEFPGDIAEPLLIDEVIKNALKELNNAGFTINSNSVAFFGGHSLGGAMLQDYLLTDNQFSKLPVPVTGIILEDAYVTRNNRPTTLESQVPPILTLGAELDGLCRLTRIAESFYFNTNTSAQNIVTIAVWGMNHYQFAGEGNPPKFVVENDLQAEISADQARDQITSITNSFIQVVLNKATVDDAAFIRKSVIQTASLVNPIIRAFQLEGFYHFNPPCYNKPQKNCEYGCKFTQLFSQKILAGANYSLNIVDQFWVVYDPPEHLPVLHNNCANLTSCLLNITTISQAVYSAEDSFDSALLPVAANEIRTKLVSRQAVIYGATGKKYDFNQTDGDSLCSLINKQSLKLALVEAPSFTVQRYLTKGIQLKIGSDIGPLNAGPLWIWTPLVSNVHS